MLRTTGTNSILLVIPGPSTVYRRNHPLSSVVQPLQIGDLLECAIPSYCSRLVLGEVLYISYLQEAHRLSSSVGICSPHNQGLR